MTDAGLEMARYPPYRRATTPRHTLKDEKLVPLDLTRTTQENAAMRPELHFVVTGGKKSFESVGLEAAGPTPETRRRGVNAG
jgi:hypothetical protein